MSALARYGHEGAWRAPSVNRDTVRLAYSSVGEVLFFRPLSRRTLETELRHGRQGAKESDDAWRSCGELHETLFLAHYAPGLRREDQESHMHVAATRRDRHLHKSAVETT